MKNLKVTTADCIIKCTGKLAKLLMSVLFITGIAAFNCQADGYCTTYKNMGTQNYTVSLTGSYYVGKEMPVGTIIHQFTSIPPSLVGITCTERSFISITMKKTPFAEPAPSFSQSGIPFTGEIYPTNVAGVGVAMVHGTSAFTFTSKSPGSATLGNGGNGSVQESISVTSNDKTIMGFRVALIKIGDIEDGSEVLASSIPAMRFFIPEQPSYPGTPLTLFETRFTGSIHFVSQTCKTPDVDVTLGDYHVNDFKGPGTTTPWTDSSILLENCPTFTGYYGEKGQQIKGSGTPSGGTLEANSLDISIRPAAGFLDAATGIIKLSETSGSADGIGIQLGYSTDINASPTSPAIHWKGESWTVTPPNDGRSSFRIPLAARYYQNSQSVTPGSADGQAMFTINYK